MSNASFPDAAILVPVGDLNKDFIGYKVRTAGIIVAYDESKAIATIASGKHLLRLGVSFIVDDDGAAGLLQLSNKVYAIGTIQETPKEDSVQMDVIAVFEVHNLDLSQWELAARQLSQSMHRSVALAKQNRLSN